MIEQEIKKNVARALNITEDEVIVKERFLGGMSNYTYHVLANQTDYVARVIGTNGNKFVNRKHELDHLNQVKALNITTSTIDFDLESGFKLTSYIPGIVLSGEMKSTDLAKVADVLHKLHRSEITGHDYDLINRLNLYESYVDTKLSKEFFDLKTYWINTYLEKYQFDKKVLCHGDAQRSNIVISNEEAFLLDFEFTGLNDPFYDIASFGNIDFNDSILLLETYLDRKPSLEEINKVRFYRMYQVLQWHVVATYKHNIGLGELLHIPFLKFAEKYLDFANYLYNQIKG